MPYQNNAPRYNNNGNNFNRGNGGAVTKKKDSTTTDGVLLSNERAGKFLKTHYWNRCLTLEIGTYSPTNGQLSYETLRNAQLFSQPISFNSIHELYDVCEEVLNSIKTSGTFESGAVEVGVSKGSIVEISNGTNINMNPGVYLVIYKDVDAGRRSGKMEIYPFTSTKVMRNYNHTTGTSNEDIRPSGEFKKFMTCLREACKALTMAQAHTSIEVASKANASSLDMLTAMAASMGVDTSKSVSKAQSGSWGNKDKAPWQGKSNYQRTSQPPQWQNRNNGGYQNQGNQSYGQSQQRQYQQNVSHEQVEVNLTPETLQQVDIANFG